MSYKKILENINENFGKYLFNNSNSLNNNIFNYLYKKNIINKEMDENIKKFHTEGYFKPSVDSFELSDYLSKEIEKQNPKLNDKRHVYFTINDQMKDRIKKHININFKSTLNKIEKYFNNKIVVAGIQLKRNYYVDDKKYYDLKINDKSKEFFNMYFHCDHNSFNYFKLFITINQINKDQGPLHFYSIKDNKEFLKKSTYKSRNDYNKVELATVKKNISKKGESLFLSTPQCMHCAGIPEHGKHRDVLFLIFVATHDPADNFFYYEKEYYDGIWNRGKSNINRIMSKPKGLRGTYEHYKKFLKSKIS